MQALARRTGIPCIWKDAALAGPGVMPRCFTVHEAPFCLEHKRRRRLFRRCVRDDVLRLGEQCHASRKPFLKVCHAGVVELVVPIFDGDCYVGAFCFGPFQGEAPPRRRFAAQLASKLPLLDDELRADAETLLLTLGGYAVSQARRSVLRERAAHVRDERIQRVVAHIHDHLGARLTADVMGSLCGLSSSRFLHVFKSEMDVSFARYVRQVRLERAKDLLTHTGLKIAEIAAELGYWNQNHFAWAFRKHTGQTATQYRAATALDMVEP